MVYPSELLYNMADQPKKYER